MPRIVLILGGFLRCPGSQRRRPASTECPDPVHGTYTSETSAEIYRILPGNESENAGIINELERLEVSGLLAPRSCVHSPDFQTYVEDFRKAHHRLPLSRAGDFESPARAESNEAIFALVRTYCTIQSIFKLQVHKRVAELLLSVKILGTQFRCASFYGISVRMWAQPLCVQGQGAGGLTAAILNGVMKFDRRSRAFQLHGRASLAFGSARLKCQRPEHFESVG